MDKDAKVFFINWIDLKEKAPELEQRVLCCTVGDDEPEILIYSNVKSYDKGGGGCQKE